MSQDYIGVLHPLQFQAHARYARRLPAGEESQRSSVSDRVMEMFRHMRNPNVQHLPVAMPPPELPRATKMTKAVVHACGNCPITASAMKTYRGTGCYADQ